jgi:crotonobetainyl-CoA:carnitine CoA-transferase CaiB-like acyl-CoA transferase
MVGQSANQGPLQGVRVIDLTQCIAGPYCTKLFADYGADVIKLEPPRTGDLGRSMGPFFGDKPHIEGSGLFLHLNTNKQSVTVDIETAGGQEIVRRLVKDADVLVESYLPGVMARCGLDYASLERLNPRLVMTSITNFGQTGPYRDYAMSEITLYALGSTMQVTGLPDRPPLKLGLTVENIYAGMVSATATMGAFFGASSHGVGQHVDLALMEIQVGNQDRAVQGQMIYQYVGRPNGGWARTGGGSMGRNLLPVGVYPCADGYVQFFTLQPLWDRVCKMIGREDLIDDPHFRAPENFSENAEVKAEFDAILLEWLLVRTKREVMEASQACGYMCGAINTMEDVFADPHLAERGFFAEVEHPYAGVLRYPGAQFKMSETPWRAGRAPLLGEHTEAVLRELGYSDAEIAALKEQGAI